MAPNLVKDSYIRGRRISFSQLSQLETLLKLSPASQISQLQRNTQNLGKMLPILNTILKPHFHNLVKSDGFCTEIVLWCENVYKASLFCVFIVYSNNFGSYF